MADWRRTVVRVGAVAGVLAAVAVLVGGALFLWTWRVDPAATVTGTAVHPEEDLHIGTGIVCRLQVRCPWYRWPVRPPEASLADGLQLVEVRRPRLVGIGAGTWQWTLEAVVQAYELGPLPGPKLSADLTADRDGNTDPLAATLPDLVITPLVADGEGGAITVAPQLAGKDGWGPRSWVYWAALGCLTAVIALILLSVLLRRTSTAATAPIPPWQIAETELQRLLGELPLAAEVFFVRLTDVLRAYLERRFHLPATEQTTAEFLQALQTSEALAVDQQQMLREFLTSADLVKFARADASLAQMEDAWRKAGQFVAETKPTVTEVQDDDEEE